MKDEISSRHKKELKTLEGEMRASLKKAKALKGKKGKDAVAEVEHDYETKKNQLLEQHAKELEPFESKSDNNTEASPTITTTTDQPSEEELQKQRKLEKLRVKREQERQKALEKEKAIQDAVDNAGPLPRDVENQQIMERHLAPRQLCMKEVQADGHCLYRAVAAQTNMDYSQVRHTCADSLLQHADEFSPFCEYTDEAPDFESYVQRVRTSADWGGHLELRALSMALQRPFIVYSAMSAEPLRIEAEDQTGNSDDKDPIQLSYHLQYYSLGEHYNQVVPATQDE